MCIIAVGYYVTDVAIDGGVNPPRFYTSHEEIEEARRSAGGYLQLDDGNFPVENRCHAPPSATPQVLPSPLVSGEQLSNLNDGKLSSLVWYV